MTSKSRLGATLFRVWLAASALYLAVILAVSVAPIKAAVHTARQPYVAPIVVHGTGPDNPPETPMMRAAEIVGRQVLIAVAPPLLALWFGWDAWFAASGFLGNRARRMTDED